MQILTYIFLGLLGTLFATLAKMSSVQKDFKVANKEFLYGRYFQQETIGIAMSIVFIIIMAFTFTEWIQLRKEAAEYIKIIFVLGGAIGSWAFLLLLGNSKRYIRKIIDIKTNIADGLPHPDENV